MGFFPARLPNRAFSYTAGQSAEAQYLKDICKSDVQNGQKNEHDLRNSRWPGRFNRFQAGAPGRYSLAL